MALVELSCALFRWVMRVDDHAHLAVVAEIQGLYGPFSFAEKLLQKIWLRGDFDPTRLATTDGRRLQITYPGKWNLLGGPDFIGARLRFGEPPGAEVHGDVEVHLHAPDWDTHAHARDPAYDRVILHVVLFPPPAGHVTRRADGTEIAVVVLLPLLHRGLEEFAADEAVELLANCPHTRLPEELGRLPADEVDDLLRREAAARWQQKVRFARLRVQTLGWVGACHHAGLEILGFRFNRAPMLRIAGRWPLADWTNGRGRPEDAFAAEVAGWSLQGVRPANHPKARLRQYANWVDQCPDWPARVRRLAAELPAVEWSGSTPENRRAAGFSRWRERMGRDLFAGTVGGARRDTLICDGILPLLSAEAAWEAAGWWYHWFPGDLPFVVKAGLRQLGYGDGRTRPLSNGVAQGLLSWLLAREPVR
jgi:hypothetical protein